MSRYTISIIALNGLEMTIRCIKSVMSAGGDFDLILTDNGSTDGTAQYFHELAKSYPNILVKSPGKNTGFIEPNNVAFEIAKLSGSEYFICLNNDAAVPDNWIHWLTIPFINDTKCAISGPMGRTLDNNFVGRGINPIDFIEGSCMMVKTALITGPLFSEYLKIAYCEDADLCLRMRQQGYSIHKAWFHLQHKSGTTTRTVPELHNTMRKNFETCRIKWADYLKIRKFPHEQ